MSKQEYINANNEITPSENLKKETLNKMKQTPSKKTYNKIYPIASLAIMCAIVLAIVMPQKSIAPINEIAYKQEEAKELPKVETFENLYAMLKEKSEKYYFNETQELYVTDSVNINSDMLKSKRVNEETEFSKTNIQVKGVDEADVVKTDGKFIYYLKRNELTITDVQDSNNIKLVTNIKFDFKTFYPNEMFLKDNKLVLIGNTQYEKQNEKTNSNYYVQNTCAKIYNISDRKNPILDRTVEIEGNYVSSRMIGDNVYLISNKRLYSYLCKEYTITELNEDDFKPTYVDTVMGEEEKYVNFDCIHFIPEFEDESYLNIAAFNVTNNEPVNIESCLGAGNQVYASNENLYITKTKYENEEISSDYNMRIADMARISYNVNTEIYKFKLNDNQCTFSATGVVPGAIINQFSMDENNGYFRIATTKSNSWNSEDNTNNLYVLNENLEIVGKIEGLAEGEKIYSVRFMGDRAYMVTFVQTDPLFVIDLSDVTKPTVLGELKIPGYSQYLHPYDETHLIGFGENTKVVNYGYGDQVITDGMKMALFDVTDPTNPKEMYNVDIGGRGTYSELLYNHKALLFSKEKNIIAFPISITQNDYEVTFQGAIVYGLDLEKGFELRGKITNMENSTDKYYVKNRVDRIIYIEDTLYTISENTIKAVDMNTIKEKSKIKI